MTNGRAIVRTLVPSRLRQKLREQFVAMRVTHLFGPRVVPLATNEAVVTCVVRNGEYYLRSFIAHYLQMGFRHIVFLDNGSSDNTLSIAKSYGNVSIYRSDLPIGANQRLFKRYLAGQTVHGGWCLDVDIDELFDYPYSDCVSLTKLLDYLNQHQYTAVLTYLLDMFSEKPLSHLSGETREDIKATYQYYDISDVSKSDYRTSSLAGRYGYANRLSDCTTELYWGGVRKTLYGNNCLLTKHSLFLPGGGVDPFPHVHFVNDARIADITAVLLHYKLTSNALASALQNRDNFTANAVAYSAFVNVLENDMNRAIRGATAQQFISAAELVANGFLSASDGYKKYAGVDKCGVREARV